MGLPTPIRIKMIDYDNVTIDDEFAPKGRIFQKSSIISFKTHLYKTKKEIFPRLSNSTLHRSRHYIFSNGKFQFPSAEIISKPPNYLLQRKEIIMKENTDYSIAAIEIVKIYFDEWKYRHESFWKRLLFFIIITFFATSMPITYSIFENLMLPNIPMVFFPFCGIILALLSYWISIAEYYRLAAVSGTIDSIIKKQNWVKHS